MNTGFELSGSIGLQKLLNLLVWRLTFWFSFHCHLSLLGFAFFLSYPKEHHLFIEIPSKVKLICCKSVTWITHQQIQTVIHTTSSQVQYNAYEFTDQNNTKKWLNWNLVKDIGLYKCERAPFRVDVKPSAAELWEDRQTVWLCCKSSQIRPMKMDVLVKVGESRESEAQFMQACNINQVPGDKSLWQNKEKRGRGGR